MKKNIREFIFMYCYFFTANISYVILIAKNDLAHNSKLDLYLFPLVMAIGIFGIKKYNEYFDRKKKAKQLAAEEQIG